MLINFPFFFFFFRVKEFKTILIFILFFQICEVGRLAIMHKDDLAKFGYGSKRKVKNVRIPLII